MTLVIRWLDGTELLSNVRDNTREILAPLLGITINLMKLAAGDLPLVAVTFLFHTHMLDFIFFLPDHQLQHNSHVIFVCCS